MVEGLSVSNFDSALWGKYKDDDEYPVNKIEMFGREYHQLRVRNNLKTILTKCQIAEEALREVICRNFYVRNKAQVSFHTLIDDCIIDNDLLWSTKNDKHFSQWIIEILINGLPEESLPLGVLFFI